MQFPAHDFGLDHFAFGPSIVVGSKYYVQNVTIFIWYVNYHRVGRLYM